MGLQSAHLDARTRLHRFMELVLLPTTVLCVMLGGTAQEQARHRSALETARWVGTRTAQLPSVLLPTTAYCAMLGGMVQAQARHRSALATARWVGTLKPLVLLVLLPTIAQFVLLVASVLAAARHLSAQAVVLPVGTRILQTRHALALPQGLCSAMYQEVCGTQAGAEAGTQAGTQHGTTPAGAWI